KTPEEEKKVIEQVNSYVKAIGNGGTSELHSDVASFALLNNLRGLAIWSYKTSQKVGEDILAYDPNPGRQQGCVSVQEATGGPARSLYFRVMHRGCWEYYRARYRGTRLSLRIVGSAEKCCHWP